MDHAEKVMDEYRVKDGVHCENNEFVIELSRDNETDCADEDSYEDSLEDDIIPYASPEPIASVTCGGGKKQKTFKKCMTFQNVHEYC